jgi:hypothetical protein
MCNNGNVFIGTLPSLFRCDLACCVGEVNLIPEGHPRPQSFCEGSAATKTTGGLRYGNTRF